MKQRFTFRTAVWAAFTAVALLSLTVGAGAVQGDKKIRMYDDCEPVSFNEALEDPNACIGNGRTTFDALIAELAATQDVKKWRNQPSQMHLNIGRSTFIENRGGETHTFTRVAEFGGGLAPELNELMGLADDLAPECFDFGTLVFIPAGASEEGPTAGTSDLPVGSSRFQCCIHPWMRTVIEVADHAPPGQNKASAAAAHKHH